MNVKEFAELMQCELYGDEIAINKEITTLYIGDVLSWVIGHGEKNQAWLTIQSHLNVLAVALLKEFSCVVVLENAEVDQETILKAEEEHMAILKTKLNAYEFATKYYSKI